MYMNRPLGEDGDSFDHLVDDWFQVAAFVAAVDANLGKWLNGRYGVGLTEYNALRHLSAAPDKELRINELANRIGLNQSSVTRLLGRLEARNLTRRETCFEDGRGVYAVITEGGEALIVDARDPYRAHLEHALSSVEATSPALGAHVVGRVLASIGGLPAS
ncbi:MarR family winged helix-turn-helix transcriptional regulator [Nocardia sp. CNY236]|uniref:MarR family winged helix-turn-helix transcriptional regulator n=1 Tax=Nocardia sp. CNY236 TaxID=1169152 RepID=UPI000427D181|nr:MarR family transcriptional regulator [Nocardia sp. CNY236]